MLLPLAELLEASGLAVDERLDFLGRASLEGVLRLSAAGVAGKKHQGRKGGDLCWPGVQSGQVSLSDRKPGVKKPRLRCWDRGRLRTNWVSRWRDGHMVWRWMAAAFLKTEKNFCRILGYRDLGMLKAKLENEVPLTLYNSNLSINS